MNRLVQENTKNNTYSYTYDNAGNRATLTATGSENYVKSYIYDKNNRLLEECKAVRIMISILQAISMIIMVTQLKG